MRLVTYLDDAGAYPETFVALPGVHEMILKEGSDGQLS